MSASAGRRPAVLLAAVLAVGLGGAASASASPRAVLLDCRDGVLDAPHSQADYASALRAVPADINEYSDCRDLIVRARLRAARALAAGPRADATPPNDGEATAGAVGARPGAVATGAGEVGAGLGAVATGAGEVGARPGAVATGAGGADTDAGLTAAALVAAATPAERQAVRGAVAGAGPAAVRLGGRLVSPAGAGLSPARAAAVIPVPLRLALGLLVAALLLGGVHGLRYRLPARRLRAPGRPLDRGR